MKLTNSEYFQLGQWREEFISKGGLIRRMFSGTYCFLPVVNNHSDTVYLSVATCNPDDNFSWNYGEYLALSRMFSGEYIVVPKEAAFAVYSYRGK